MLLRAQAQTETRSCFMAGHPYLRSCGSCDCLGLRDPLALVRWLAFKTWSPSVQRRTLYQAASASVCVGSEAHPFQNLALNQITGDLVGAVLILAKGG